MLLDYYYQTMTRKIKTEGRDSEGGTITTWADGKPFTGAIVKSGSNPVTEGDSIRLYNTYTLTVSREESLHLHDVFADREGVTYRIISNANQTPQGWTDLDMKQYTAEEWKI